MILWLDEQDDIRRKHKRPARTARAQVVVRQRQNNNQLIELIIDLERNEVVKQQHLVGKHPYIDSAYMKEVEEACMADPWVQRELSMLELPAEASVVAEPWAYSTDGLNDMSERLTMVSTQSFLPCSM